MIIKKHTRNYAIILIGAIGFGSTTYATTYTPENIRIGLESIYKDTYEIKLSSDDGFDIGYFEGDRWEVEGSIDEEVLYVSSSAQTYYAYDEQYRSYEDALEVLEVYDSKSVIAYIEPNTYQIYTEDKNKGDEQVATNSHRISITNEEDEVILISENIEMPLGFQGALEDYNFGATRVGAERVYRGVIEVVKGQYKGVTAVNVVDFEEYLYGVLNNEMSYSYPEEALKAQAVTARSIAMFQYSRHLSKGYNLVDTVYSQVYKGVLTEHPITTKAVEDTKGEIVTYNGKPIETLYFGSSGGHTESAEHVWGNEVEYLKGVPDPFESVTDNRNWTRHITLQEIERCLSAIGINIGRVEGMEIMGWTNSGRVEELRILGTQGTHDLTKESVRTFFSSSDGGSLMSTMYKFEPYDTMPQVMKTIAEPVLTPVHRTQAVSEGISKITVETKDGKYLVSLDGMLILGDQEATFIKNDPISLISKEDIVQIQPQKPQNQVPSTSDKDEEVEDEEEDQSNQPNRPSDDALQGTGNYVPNDKTTVVYGDVTLYGKGFGHGVGMSQTGAKGMALAGYDYVDIIEHYYSGAQVQ